MLKDCRVKYKDPSEKQLSDKEFMIVNEHGKSLSLSQWNYVLTLPSRLSQGIKLATRPRQPRWRTSGWRGSGE